MPTSLPRGRRSWAIFLALGPLTLAAACGHDVPVYADDGGFGPGRRAGARDASSNVFDSGVERDARGAGDGAPEAGSLSFDLLQANVGNVSADCSAYRYKLCSVEVEQRLTASIRARGASMIALQEVVPDTMCDNMTETRSNRVCLPGYRAVEPNQARRLVGPGYSIACDSRVGYDCLAVSVDFGTIRGCDPGAFCNGVGQTLPADAGCDDGFTVSSYVVDVKAAAPIVTVVGHPASGAAVACRAQQVGALFDVLLAEGLPALVAGDLNLDPYRQSDESIGVFKSHVGPLQPYRLLSGLAEHDPPYFTSFGVLGNQTYDHVLSNVVTGTCSTLGEAPNTTRLDGGSGCDHRAEVCMLQLPR